MFDWEINCYVRALLFLYTCCHYFIELEHNGRACSRTFDISIVHCSSLAPNSTFDTNTCIMISRLCSWRFCILFRDCKIDQCSLAVALFIIENNILDQPRNVYFVRDWGIRIIIVSRKHQSKTVNMNLCWKVQPMKALMQQLVRWVNDGVWNQYLVHIQ
jgi:hypothetical protein